MTPCFNEASNVRALSARVKEAIEQFPEVEYEHVFVDNASTDGTAEILREMAAADRHVKVILNSRNFGVVRSSYYGLLQCHGDAVIPMAADFQDPPDLIPEFIRKWEEGFRVVLAVKSSSKESRIMYGVRRLYYRLVNRLSEVPLIDNFYGYGLYDRKVMDALRAMEDPYPYFRGLVTEVGFRRVEVPFVQPARKHGSSSYNFYRLYDIAMLGITSHSKVPLRLATMLGFLMSALSFVVGLGYLIAKLVFWKQFTMGVAPILIAVFFLGSVHLFFTGILGEYLGFIYTQVLKRPLVIESERINFEDSCGKRDGAEGS